MGESVADDLPELTDRGTLKLVGFTGADRKGWLSTTAVNGLRREWSVSFRVNDPQIRLKVEFVLAEHIGISLSEIGDSVAR